MLDNFSIRNKLIICILVGCLIPYLLSSFYIKNKTEEWLYKSNIEHTNIMLQQAADHVDDSVLKNTEDLISIIAEDERLLHTYSQIHSYIHYDPSASPLDAAESESEILKYFRQIKENQDIIEFVSFGTEEGGYAEYPDFNPPGPYDPRGRQWYLNAIHKEDAIISEPYITKVTNDLVISVDKSVTLDHKKIGVVSLTIKLDQLMNKINGLKYSESGYICILSPNNVFINSPDHEEWTLNSIEDLGLDVFHSLDEYNGKSFEGQIDDTEKVFNVYISPYSGWKYISVMDKDEILEQSSSLTDFLFIIYSIMFLLVMMLIFLISNYITKPILKIAQAIKKMATFDFDIYEKKNFELYIHQKDEIGEISRALNNMQDNFIELKNNMAIIDQEIQKIDIDQETVYQLHLSKDNPFSGIMNSVNGLLEKVNHSIKQINSQKEFIHYLADHDPLTGLPNRRKFQEKLSEILHTESQGAILLLDLDNFKGINDTLGHLFGDKVLKYISRKLKERVNQRVFVSRFGGDEFLILYEYKEGREELRLFIEELFQLFQKPFQIEKNEVKVEFSMGISTFPKDSQDFNQLIMYADLALYFVKNSGKHSYAFFNKEMDDHLKQKWQMKSLLREAITNDGFKMVYQPQIDLYSGEILGYEALIRLKGSAVSPKDFIPVAEEDDLIIAIGRKAVQMVVTQLCQWQQKGLEMKPVAINFSAVQIHDYNFKNHLLKLLKENNVDPNLIVLEITENVFLENTEATLSFLQELREYGIRIAIDDFGTGYSSLSYLTFLPIDTIKLDRNLSMKFLNFDSNAVIDSFIALAHSLGLKVIAEGIEDYEQVKRLMIGKCDAVQGFYFSMPLEVSDVEKNFYKIYQI